MRRQKFTPTKFIPPHGPTVPLKGNLSVKDKIKAWKANRAAEETKALAEIDDSVCETLITDLRRYAGWNYFSDAEPEDVDRLLALSFTLEELATTCRVLARGAEYQLQRLSEQANG